MLQSKYSTPITIATFAVVAITGVMMFFHFKPGGTVAVHEWVGMLFVVGAFLHMATHNKSLVGHFKRRASMVLIVLLVAIGGVAVVLIKDEKSPVKKVFSAIEAAPISKVAPVIGKEPAQIISKLNAAGITVNGDAESIAEISKREHKNPKELFTIILD